MKSITKITASIACLAAAASYTMAAAPKDITTYLNPDSSFNVEARYAVHVGFNAAPYYNQGLTTTTLNLNPNGLVEITSSGGVNGSGNYGRMNNALTSYAADGNFSPSTSGGHNPDYFGYQFDIGVINLTKIDFWNSAFGTGVPGPTNTRLGGAGGGVFDATPQVQYLDAMEPLGTWHTISNVTWDPPYNASIPASNVDVETRHYVINVNQSLGTIWGVRLIGNGKANGNTTDPDGWVAVQELSVTASLDIGDTDITKNRALSGTAIASAEQGAGQTVLLNDGNIATRSQTYGPWAGEDYYGITWGTPQYRLTSLGIAFMTFFDGGLFDDCSPNVPLRIEYTTSANSDWTPVTGLNKRRYPYLWQRLSYLSNNVQLAFLFSFDEINDVTGLRIIGDPDGDGGNRDGFLGAFEIEVFGKPLIPEGLDLDPVGAPDGDIDGADTAVFATCLSGDHIPQPLPQCKGADVDKDGDVDMKDYAVMQQCFTGAGHFYDPLCGLTP